MRNSPCTEDILRKRTKYLNSVVNHFWNRWAKEYLQELRNAHRYPNNKQHSSPVREGDIVVVRDPDLPRGFWKIARVTRLLTGNDGNHRGAVLRVAARGEQATTLQRPLQLLYPLEIHCCLAKGDQDQAETVTQEAAEPTNEIPTKDHDQDEPTVYNDCSVSKDSSSKRLSALRAQERLKNWTAELMDNHD